MADAEAWEYAVFEKIEEAPSGFQSPVMTSPVLQYV
jgi:UDP-3-O-[3-hydroxymyristoyl] N-acetylglucosamine deacetylase